MRLSSTFSTSGPLQNLQRLLLTTKTVSLVSPPSGGAYHSILRRLETFTDEPLRTALKDHETCHDGAGPGRESGRSGEKAEGTRAREPIPTLVCCGAH